MNKIKIFTDSTSDLTRDILRKYDVSVIPLYVNFDDDSLKDGVEITTEGLYSRVENNNKLPKTSAPSPGDFYNEFKPYIEEGCDILYIGLSSHISSTIQNASIAAKEFPEGRIEIIDSLNLSSAIGLLVMKACDYVLEGYSLSEIADKVRKLVPRVVTYFIIDTLDYLHKGGRCTALQSFIGGILRIRPVIKVINGDITLWEKLRGKREKALSTMLDSVLREKDNIEPDRIMVTHSMGESDAKLLKQKLDESLNVGEVIITDAGCVISSHCGPNTVGILYIEKEH